MARSGLAVARQPEHRPCLQLVRDDFDPDRWLEPDELIVAPRPRRHLRLVEADPCEPNRREYLLPLAAVAQVQNNKGATAAGGATSVSCTWGSTTTVGNLLVAFVTAKATGTNLPTFTAPAGWSSAPPTRQGGTGGSNQDPSGQIFYLKNCGARSGSESWTISASADAILYLFEYSGADTTAPYDVEASGGSSTASGTVSAGTTGAIAATGSLDFVGLSAKNQLRTFSSPSNGSIVRQDATTNGTNANGITAGVIEFIGGTSGGTISNGCTVAASSQNVGVQAVFKPASGGSKTVAGSAAGAASCTGSVNQTFAAVQGSAAGAASCSGAVSQTNAAVAGSAAGAASCTGSVTRTASVAGSANGAASCSGAVARTASVAGSAAGVATCTGALDEIAPPDPGAGVFFHDPTPELHATAIHDRH